MNARSTGWLYLRHIRLRSALIVGVVVLAVGNLILSILLTNADARSHPSEATSRLDAFMALPVVQPVGLHPQSDSNNNLPPVDNINLTEYFVFDNACLVRSNGPLEWKLIIQNDTYRVMKRLQNHSNTIHMNVYDFVLTSLEHTFQITVDPNLNFSLNDGAVGRQQRRQNGAYMVMSHHTPNNNFHLHNDLLLPAYRAHLKTRIQGIAFLRGCVPCWEKRLPLMSHVLFQMLNLTFIYPLERVVPWGKGTQPLCFDRLIFQGYSEFPFYSHSERFSDFWPHQLFANYRDRVHEYFRNLPLLSSTSTSLQQSITNSESKRPIRTDTNRKSHGTSINDNYNNSTTPVLTWIGRHMWNNTCNTRCIQNEQVMITELSKYFHVNFINFGNDSTIEHAMACIMVTDVLVGLHGAGLGFTSLLPDHAMVVELRGLFGREKRIFLNMAASLSLPYYATDLAWFNEGDNKFTLPVPVIRDLSKQISLAHHCEKDNSRQQRLKNASSFLGQCNFPQHVMEPCGHLSSGDVSRCYLQNNDLTNGEWMQCTHFNVC